MRQSSATTSDLPAVASTLVVARSPSAAFSIRKWLLGHRRDLGQVGDAQHLARVAERAQALTDRAGGLAADAGVDLVEHQRPRRADPRDGHQREHHARQLAARRALADRGGRAPPGSGASRNSTRSAPVATISSRGSSTTSKAAPSIASDPSSSLTRLGQLRRGLGPRRAQLARQRRPLGDRGLELGLGLLERPPRRSRCRSTLGPAALAVLEHRGHGAAVLAQDAVVGVEPRLDLLEPLRVRVEPAEVVAQLGGQVLRLDPQRPQALAPARRAPGPPRPRRRPRPRRQRSARSRPPSPSSGARASPPARGGRAQDIDPARGAPARRRGPRARRLARARGRRSRRARTGSRSRSRSRGPARSRSSSSARSAARTRVCAARHVLSQRRGARRRRSRPASSSCAAATVSLRCSCWPKKATSRPPSSRRSAAVAERPWT